jgi:hypothetical protein
MTNEGGPAAGSETVTRSAAERPPALARAGLYLSFLPLAASLIDLILRPG